MPSTISSSYLPTLIETKQTLSNLSQLPSGADLGSALAFGHLDSQELLQGQKSVTIVHNGTAYRLQATKLGKLILTK